MTVETPPTVDAVRRALPAWGIAPEAEVKLLTHSENAVYSVAPAAGPRVVLRIHRPDYHSKNAIAGELAWLHALHEERTVEAPVAVAGCDGASIQTVALDGIGCRHAVAFEFMDGEPPAENDEQNPAAFERLGEVTARLHRHALGWRRPHGFERLRWDDESILGAQPHWGDWRCAPGMDAAAEKLLGRQQAVIRRRLRSFGAGGGRFSLIHADLRPANLLLHGGATRVIDFDDCGFGWLLYDLAAAFSFFEGGAQVPALTDCWLRGYRRIRPLSAAEENEIPTFLMLRRMALLAWIGSHPETALAARHAPFFTRDSCAMAEDFLSAAA